MNGIPKIETVTRDVTVSHLFLMLGYKLFAFYFPLFLVQKGLSISEVGYAFLLIYLPIALFAPIAGLLNHRVNPSLLMSVGIAGYGLYSLGMIFVEESMLFYMLQIMLGISAALFFVSSRAILMGMHLEKPDRSFGWFYSVPFYTDVLGPALGALLIFKFGFIGVFCASLGFYAFDILYTLVKLHKKTDPLRDHVKVKDVFSHYAIFFRALKRVHSASLMVLAFVALITGGFYHAFFLLFLKDLGWTQNEILIFGVLTAALFTPFSLFAISRLGKEGSRKNILHGLTLYSFVSLVFGMAGKGLSFAHVVILTLLKDLGSFVANAGRSGKITKSFSSHPEEAAAIDTMFSPLGQSMGFLLASLFIGKVGYSLLFIGSGLLVLVFLLLVGIAKKDNLG